MRGHKFLNGADAFWQRPAIVGLGIGLLVFFSVVGVYYMGRLEPLELAAYDGLIRLSVSAQVSQPRVALVTISETEIQSLGHWPLSDADLAHVLGALIPYRPVAIGVDIYRDVSVPPGHENLTRFLTENSNVVFPMKCRTTGQTGIQPPAVLMNTDQVGFVDMVVDQDGIVRRGLLFMDDGQNSYYALSLRLALKFLASRGVFPQRDPITPDYLRLGPNVIQPFQSDDGGYFQADDRGYQFLLDFRFNSRMLPTVSLTTLLSGKAAPDAFHDRIVLIGVTAESVNDYFYTPLSQSKRFDQEIPGVCLHALAAQQLIEMGMGERTPIGTLMSWQEILWILIWSLAGGVMGSQAQSVRYVGLTGSAGLFILIVSAYTALDRAVWIPLAPPVLAWIASMGCTTVCMLSLEKRQRRQLMKLFATHVSPEFAETIWQERNQFLLHGRILPQKLTATVMFSDIVGFTSTSESLSPEILINWLNELMAVMIRIVIKHQGVTNKFIGDSIMAVFGVPVPRRSAEEIRQDAINAVACALDMQDQLVLLNQQWQIAGLPTVVMRIGIYTGELVTGSLGGVDRMEYTVIGDTVNVASRLESFEKTNLIATPLNCPCRICIGESTMKCTADMFEMEPMEPVLLKGKLTPMPVYRVVSGRATGMSDA